MKHILQFPSKPLFLLSLCVFSVTQNAQSAPVGMAAQVKGSVQLESGGTKTPLKLLGRVENGDIVRCAPGAHAIIVLFGGGRRFEIGSNQSATIGAGDVIGGKKMAGLSGPSADVVQKLGKARVGAVMARPPEVLQRLTPQFPGWLPAGHPTFEWLPLAGAANYTFTLFDAADNVVWSVRSDKLSANYPAEAPELRQQRPYLWQLSGFGNSGKAVDKSRSGLVTFLAPADATALTKLAADLQAQAANTDDKTPLLLLAEAYLQQGVAGLALEVFDDEKMRGTEGLAEARHDVIQSLSPFARTLAQSQKSD